MEDFTNLFLLIGGIVAAFLLLGGTVLWLGTYLKKRKTRRSLADGSDNTEFTENFIRQYDNQ